MAEKQIGEVTNFFEHVNAAAIKLTAPLKVGDTIEFKGGEIDFEQKVDSMQIQRKPVKTAKKGDEIGILVKDKVRKGYKVFKK
ncbi:MAG: translation elongation factor-like protein [Candidatus Nanoarchaeia archaeon]|nr:translation elongation factor-like protein [Candidatus Nanoarchaeia archaeon]MDD5741491.1 translation elongation factor-like protein [Candidatus Nanoarchaeia archaeon]